MDELHCMRDIAALVLEHRFGQCGPVQQHLAAGCVRRTARDHIEQRLFTATLRAQDGHHLAAVQCKVDTLQHKCRILLYIQAAAAVHLKYRKYRISLV